MSEPKKLPIAVGRNANVHELVVNVDGENVSIRTCETFFGHEKETFWKTIGTTKRSDLIQWCHEIVSTHEQ